MVRDASGLPVEEDPSVGLHAPAEDRVEVIVRANAAHLDELGQRLFQPGGIDRLAQCLQCGRHTNGGGDDECGADECAADGDEWGEVNRRKFGVR